ncbi:MAG: adenine deaminase C-terminal domain-containing protein [Thermodesulfobacteriota bacterium]
MSELPSLNRACRPAVTTKSLRRLMAVAAGREPADVLIKNVVLVNVHTARLEEGVSLALCGDRIAARGPDLDGLIGPKTAIMDGRGQVCAPGMIDAHTHLDSLVTVRNFARLALIGGNTCLATEMAMMANAAGAEGVFAFMAEASNLPLRVFFLAPPLIPPFPDLETSAGLDWKTFKKLLQRPDVLGVGETYWRPALELKPHVLDRLAAGKAAGKTLEGHAAGARGVNLTAYRAGGITSCHEATTADEALERLNLGYAVQIREGYIRRELEAMGPLAARSGLDGRRLILVTDTASPDMLLQTGIMNELIRRAVEAGFNPLAAVRMLTLNPADYFGLPDLGRLDPGALADLVLLDDLENLNINLVMVGGRVVVSRGLLTVDIPDHPYPAGLTRGFKLRRIEPDDLRLTGPSGPIRVRVVAVRNETVTQEEIVETRAVRGRVQPDPGLDLVKIAVFDRHSPEPRGAVGLARGLGLKSGAVASSLLWDTNNLLIAGVTDREMALAANRLIELQGGLVVVRGRKVLAEMPLPIAGIMSDRPLADVLAQGDAVEKAVHDLGSPIARPLLIFQTLCFTGLPFIRLTDKGLVDVRKGTLVDVVLK